MIYIKDMDMPVDCLACRISCKHESYLVTGRPKDCPLEEAKDGDIISRADAIDAVIEYWDGYAKPLDSWDVMNQTRAVLETLPSAEAVQGEWVRKYDDKINCYWYECDQCGEYRPRNQIGHEYNSNFCPNCGARMKGGGTE